MSAMCVPLRYMHIIFAEMYNMHKWVYTVGWLMSVELSPQVLLVSDSHVQYKYMFPMSAPMPDLH